MSDTSTLNPISRLTRDLASAAATLSDDEARFLVSAYYMMQEDRKRAYNQERALETAEKPHAIVSWLAEQSETLENQIKRALDKYTDSHPMGAWMRATVGIGPVISAGLLAHIDISKCPTVGHIWSFAGIAGTGQKKWVKGEKRPFNASLKTLCWKAGQSFMKFSGNENCYYGQVYRKRKELEVERNEAGLFAEQAAAGTARVSKSTEAYKHYAAGKLPPGHIDARARRYAVKLFLAHMHGHWHQLHFGTPAPLPYPVAHMGHVHVIPPPH